MKNIMVDIETLGIKPGCAILSVGAIEFNPFSKDLGYSYYNNVDLNDAIHRGFFTDPDTVAWWEKQSQEAKDHLTPNQQPIHKVLSSFINWFESVGGVNIWCHGATFDAPILEHSMSWLGLKIPWKYYNVRDTRTVFDLFQLDIRKEERVGTYHNALDDAKFQAICIQKALNQGS